MKSKNDNDIVIDNFLNQQRLLEILGNQEIKALQEAEDLQITFENTAQTHDGVYSVYLLKENQNLNVLYGFSENTIFVYDEETTAVCITINNVPAKATAMVGAGPSAIRRIAHWLEVALGDLGRRLLRRPVAIEACAGGVGKTR